MLLMSHRHFAYLFQIADDAMQMDVDKSLYPFYAPKIMPHVHGRRRGAGSDMPSLNFEICNFPIKF